MRRLVCNRRGEEDIWNAITLVAGAMVGIFLVLIVYRFSSTDMAYTAFFAKDGAMLADAMLAVPQSIELIYPKEFKSNYARFKDGEFQVFSNEKAAEYGVDGYTPYRYSFIPRKDISLDSTLSPLSIVYFIKNQTAMMISNIPLILTVEKTVNVAETALPEARDFWSLIGGSSSDSISQEQKAKLQALFTEYQAIEALCFKDMSVCGSEINNHKEACKEFKCLCTNEKEKFNNKCQIEKPYFIIGTSIPSWLKNTAAK